MILAQCDATVSLTDDNYYNRAWCSLEAMMVNTLRKSYGTHKWYEQTIDVDEVSARRYGSLRDGPMGLDIGMADKELGLEEDRPTVLFLERQIKLLE